MPTYVYECSHCKQVFEAEQRITEEPLRTCSVCGKGPVKRVIQPVGVMFKGSGFHINDYAAAGAGPKAEEKKEEAPPGAAPASEPAPAPSEAPAKEAPPSKAPS